jgi:hypothetical protein
MTGEIVMNKIMTTCFAAAAFCGAAATASANPMPGTDPVASNAMHATVETPATLAQLQDEITMLQAETGDSGTMTSQDTTRTYFSPDAPANPGGSPIPFGG